MSLQVGNRKGGGGGGGEWILMTGCTSPAHIQYNSLSPNSDHHQISPCNINAHSTPEVMRIKDMITQGEFS